MKYMAEEDYTDDGQSLNDQPDKTGEEENEDLFNDDTTEEDEPIDEENEDEEEEKKKKLQKSEIAQKIKYREKFLKSQEDIRELKSKLNNLENKGESTNEAKKELAAKEYIRKQAREEYEAIQAEQKAREEEKTERFENQLEKVMDSNPDFTEEQIMEICEEEKVEPDVAVSILKRINKEKGKKKPKLPSAKRASTKVGGEDDDDKGDEKESMWDMATKIKKSLKK